MIIKWVYNTSNSKRLLHKNNFKGLLNRNCCSFPQDDFIKCLTMDSLRERLLKNINKWPKYRMTSSNNEFTKTAAVLVPICEISGELSLLYTLRSSKLRTHSRQVAFPGGIRDESDDSFEACAVREAFEEIGVDKSNIEIWGRGNAVKASSNVLITPVLGSIPNIEDMEMKINPDEVEKVFTVPLSTLIDKNQRMHTQFRSGYSVPIYMGGEERIWGMTAIITHTFLSLVCPSSVYHQKIHYLKKYSSSS